MATMMRAGTSKGLFIDRRELPHTRSEWAPIIASVMGCREGEPRQIDGLGGGTSTTSKVAIVSPSTDPNIDVEYTFCQARVGEDSVDFSGTCGNMLSGVGAFALDEGMVQAKPGENQVRCSMTQSAKNMTDGRRGQYSDPGHQYLSYVPPDHTSG
jgi:2-methylaconitate cis-trans-isomerase PrpF